MATTKRNRRFSGMSNVVAAHRRNSKPAAPAAPAATEQSEILTVDLDASPVNGKPAAPAAPAAAPEVPSAAPEVPEQKEPAESVDVPPAAPAGFTAEQEIALIAMGLKTLLGIEGDVPLTPEGLLNIGLRTARQALTGILADEAMVAGIKAKREELMGKAKALIPTVPTGKKEEPKEETPAKSSPTTPRVVGIGFESRWLPTGQIAEEVRVHVEDKLVGVEGEANNYRWYKIGGKLVWDYK